MKKISFFALALAAGLMMGCSDEVGNDVNPGGTGSATVGEGFMSVAINLPSTTGGSRASVDGFDDGLETEYAVNDGQLIIFGGNDEGDATYQASYDLNVTGFQEDADDQISRTKTVTVSTQDMTGPNFFAVVLLNANGQNLSLTKGTTFTNFEGQVLTPASEATLRTKGFLMINSPLSTVSGGVNKPENVTIMKYPSFNATKIKNSQAEAEADPAAEIYVERIHAKVTLAEGQNMTSPDEAELGKMSIVGWTLDNTNKSTYLMRNVKASDAWWVYKSTKAGTEYRFIEDDPVAAGLYRTYWCTDPNYSDWKNTYFNNATTETATYSDKFGSENPQYCLENTFNTENQREQSTTSVLVKAQFNNGQDFYIKNNDKSTIYTAEDIENDVKTMWQSYLETIKDEWFTTGTFSGENIDVTLSTTAGAVTAATITLTAPQDIAWVPGKNLAGLQTEATNYLTTINKNLKAELYKGGVAYYRLLIKHFGDEDTPWSQADRDDEDYYPDVTGATGENQWLGRYGMVRNNWYDLTVTGARELGSSTVPEVTNKPDDSEGYLAVTINILSWAKRTQSVIL